MQSKGAIRLVAILLALACIWQLSFTLVTRLQEKKADKYAEFGLEGQAAPGEYRCGYLNTNYVQMYFDTVYTTFSYVGTVESDQAGVYTFAFYLSNIEEANTYYIKNIKFKEIYVPGKLRVFYSPEKHKNILLYSGQKSIRIRFRR